MLDKVDRKLKHLELIQNIINRMNSSSFIIKGWSITLVSGLFALSITYGNIPLIIASLFVLLIFWIMDGFYISRERMFRDLYEDVATKNEDQIDFKMMINHYYKGNRTWFASIFSKTLLPFYLPILLGLVTIYIVTR
ncbi:hypothetical protein [Aquimarina sp. MMG016]|uniref:hypothetical protein n=1 Tax=Aquimarina sp. MMG016 TaxID=2822690 RepID=UPI001B3A4667|nr:hypothetical protein [Aquimarina sp. MMG016]MBQ4822204.1 hypothetical protein [Aquimarina sp. MMG016]